MEKKVCRVGRASYKVQRWQGSACPGRVGQIYRRANRPADEVTEETRPIAASARSAKSRRLSSARTRRHEKRPRPGFVLGSDLGLMRTDAATDCFVNSQDNPRASQPCHLKEPLSLFFAAVNRHDSQTMFGGL